MWEQPIFDRTQSDVDYAAANRDDPNHYKGAFNYTDMLRITNNMAHIARLINAAISAKTDWQKLDIPKVSELQAVLDDLAALRAKIAGIDGEIPQQPIYHYEKINQIERLIFDMERRASRLNATHRRLNTFGLGGDII